MKNILKNYYFVAYSMLNEKMSEVASSSATISLFKFQRFKLTEIQDLIKNDVVNSRFILKDQVKSIIVNNIVKL